MFVVLPYEPCLGSTASSQLGFSSQECVADTLHLRCVLQIRDIGSGNFGVAKLMRNRVSNELVAVKFIERGERVSFWHSLSQHQQLLSDSTHSQVSVCAHCPAN